MEVIYFPQLSTKIICLHEVNYLLNLKFKSPKPCFSNTNYKQSDKKKTAFGHILYRKFNNLFNTFFKTIFKLISVFLFKLQDLVSDT